VIHDRTAESRTRHQLPALDCDVCADRQDSTLSPAPVTRYPKLGKLVYAVLPSNPTGFSDEKPETCY
jgi:hypothetical protein